METDVGSDNNWHTRVQGPAGGHDVSLRGLLPGCPEDGLRPTDLHVDPCGVFYSTRCDSAASHVRIKQQQQQQQKSCDESCWTIWSFQSTGHREVGNVSFEIQYIFLMVKKGCLKCCDRFKCSLCLSQWKDSQHHTVFDEQMQKYAINKSFFLLFLFSVKGIPGAVVFNLFSSFFYFL